MLEGINVHMSHKTLTTYLEAAEAAGDDHLLLALLLLLRLHPKLVVINRLTGLVVLLTLALGGEGDAVIHHLLGPAMEGLGNIRIQGFKKCIN